jgi:hypothetical protein
VPLEEEVAVLVRLLLSLSLLLCASVAYAAPDTRPRGGAHNGCLGITSVCGTLSDADGDGDIADDFQRVANTLLWPLGADAQYGEAYIVAPPPGVYNWETQVILCGDTTATATDSTKQYNSTTGRHTEVAPDCTGTTGTTPTLYLIGDWSSVIFNCTAVVSTGVTPRQGCLSIGNAQDRAGTAVDGYAAATDAVAGGEFDIRMQSRMYFTIYDNANYNTTTGPGAVECLGCRGHIDAERFDDRSGAFNTDSAFFLYGQNLTANVYSITSQEQVDFDSTGAGVKIGGPMVNTELFIKSDRAGVTMDDAACLSASWTCSQVAPRLHLDVRKLADSNGFTFEYGSPYISGRFTMLDGGTHASAIEGSAVSSSKIIGTPTIHDVAIDAYDCSRGCITLKSCSATVSPYYTVDGLQIIQRGTAVAAYSGGIGARREDTGSCSVGHSTGNMPPIVKVSDYSYFDASGNGYHAFGADVSSGDMDGVYIPQWADPIRIKVSAAAAAGASGNCIDFTSPNNNAIVACTDERTILRYPNSEALVAWVAGRIVTSVAAGKGCRIVPVIGGTDDTDARHQLDSGVTGFETAGDVQSILINRIVAAGTTIQFSLRDSAETCDAGPTTDTNYSFMVAPLGDPDVNSAPFGTGK